MRVGRASASRACALPNSFWAAIAGLMTVGTDELRLSKLQLGDVLLRPARRTPKLRMAWGQLEDAAVGPRVALA